MTKKQSINPADYIEPLYMNGLRGRMLRLKPRPRKQKEFLIVYGQHTSLERIFSLADDLNKFGGVTVPDLPGFGGMQSFYRLNEKPSIDNLADYLAAFVKLRYKNRRVSIIGMAFGFVVVTRMLQRYPEITKKVDLLISLCGFVHKEDLILNRYDYFALRTSSGLLSQRLTSSIARLFLRPAIIKSSYLLFNPKSSKLATAYVDERDERIAFEIHLWRTNDLRTQMYSNNQSLKLDLCHSQVPLNVHHVALKNNNYVNEDLVEQHLNVIYKKIYKYIPQLKTGSLASVFYKPEDVKRLIPTSLKKIINKI